MVCDRKEILPWIAVALYVNAVLWSIPYVRPLSRALRSGGVPNWFLGGASVVFAASALLSGFAKARRRGRATKRRIASLLLATGLYAGLIGYLSPIPDEVVHVAEYGVLGLLYGWALGDGAGAWSPWLAVLATGVTGVMDEITQGVTPGRVCDPRDMLTNVVSGGLAIWMLRPNDWIRPSAAPPAADDPRLVTPR